MDSPPEHNPRQASHTKPTVEEIKRWDEDELRRQIQQKAPNLLKGDKLEKFKNASIEPANGEMSGQSTNYKSC